jgi:predicted dehydrogenase
LELNQIMHSTSSISRRRFLAAGALTTSSLAFPAILHSASPNQKIRLIVIGSGGRGGSNLGEVSKDPQVEIVALCDVNKRNLEAAGKRHPQAKQFTDFRELYAQIKDYDGAVVSTTEHTHAYATMPALRAKKAVYSEKPLTHNVLEARLITEAAAKSGAPTQMGTQIHAGSNYHRVVELIQSGAIGNVKEAHVWVSRAWGLQSAEEAKAHGDIVNVTERPQNAMPPPDYVDWDLWIGPAPFRPYHDVYFPGPKWYRWWDFGNGTMSDLGSHWNDLPFWALKLDAPLTIEASGPPPHAELAPASMKAVYEYGARGSLPPCRVTWHQGTEQPQILKEGKIPGWKDGVLFIGEKGMLLSDYGRHQLLPEADFKGFKAPAPFIPDSPGHQQEWLNAIKNGTSTASPFSYAGPLTEANHLGNVAFRAGKKLQWDSKNLRFPNAPEAEKFLSRKPREGWSLG